MATAESTIDFWHHTGVDELDALCIPHADGTQAYARDQKQTDYKSGDLVLFSGNDIWGQFIRLFTQSKWSHVGMIVCDEQEQNPHIYEMRARRGAQITPLQHRVNTFKGKMAIRQIKSALNGQQLERLYEYVDNTENKPFDVNYVNLIDSFLMFWTFNIKPLQGFFDAPTFEQCQQKNLQPNADNFYDQRSSNLCTELLLGAMDDMSIRGHAKKLTRPAQTYLPQDFASDSVDEHFCCNNPDCLYAREVPLK